MAERRTGSEERRDAVRAMLLLAARAELGTADEACRAQCTSSPLDWTSFAARATEQGLAPLAWRLVADHPGIPTPPTEIQSRLRTAFVASAVHHMRTSIELDAVLSASRESGICPITLKGPALARYAYRDPALRPYADLDLLVAERDWATFHRVVVDLGYVVMPPGNVVPLACYLRLPAPLTAEDTRDHTLSYSGAGKTSLDCTLDPLELGVRMRSLADAFALAEEVSFEEQPGLVLSPDYQLVTLCVHLNRHGYRRLIWLVDIATLLARRSGTLDWERIVAICALENVSASIHYTLMQVDRLLGVAAPADALERLRPNRFRSALWVRAWPERDVGTSAGREHVLIEFPKSFSVSRLAGNLAATGRVGDKMRYLARRAFPPSSYLASKVSAGPAAGYTRRLTLYYRAAILKRWRAPRERVLR